MNDKDLEELIANYDREGSKVKDEIKKLRDSVDKLSKDMQSISSAKKEESKPKVILPFAIKPALAREENRIEMQVIEYIKKEIDKSKVQVDVSFDWEHRKENVPLAVFCNNASRIGVDVEYALTGVQDPEVVLIILHYCQKALLRGDLSDTDYLLPDELRKRVGCIAHFAFDDNVYDCEQNRNARRKLRSQIDNLLQKPLKLGQEQNQ